MSYISKEWKDMIVQYPTRYKIIHADQSEELVTMVNEFGDVTQEGDVFDAQTFNDFEGRINDAVISTIFGTLDPTSAVGKNGDIYLKTSSGSITAVYAKVDNTWLALPTGGGGGATVYVGTTDPDSSLGENGNLYAKYHTDVTPVVDAFYVKISGSWASVSTGGGGLVGLELTQTQYEALTPAEKMNGTVYFITDANNLPDYESLTFPLDEGD